jgi:sugar phosphate isomerase/epimerase
MFRISAFADEIGPDPVQQLDVLAQCGVRHLELRSILGTNVLALTDAQVEDLRSLLRQRGVTLSAIGSPIGKVPIDGSFEDHLSKFERAIHLARLFEAPNIRVFSYYPPGDGPTWDGVDEKWHAEVFARMRRKAEIAEKAGVRLVHENEHRIYGDSPERVARIFREAPSPTLRAAYDAANFVYGGFCPWEGWEMTRHLTVHFHIKDWRKGEKHGCLAGEGDGRWPEVLRDARGYDGFATLEPHLLGGGPTGGHTGPELFPRAVEAFRKLLQEAGLPWA